MAGQGNGNNELIQVIKRLALLLHQNIDLHLKPYDLARTQYVILRSLHDTGSLPTGDLLAKLRVEAGTLSGLIDTLEDKGLVQRVEQAGDKRRKDVHLTADGIGLVEKIPPPGPLVERAMLRGLSRQEAHEFRRVGWQMIANLEMNLRREEADAE